jgi:hypothetical protein
MPTNDELELDEIDDASPSAPHDLRKYAERMKARAQEAEAAKRENAFLRAGIDTSKTLGKAFLATYDGDLSDTAAILEAAKEFPGIIRGEAAKSAEGDTSATQGSPVNETDPAASAPAPSGTDQRRALADGATAAAAVISDPVENAHMKARELLSQGRTRDEALGEAVALQVRALANGEIQALDAFGRPVQ